MASQTGITGLTGFINPLDLIEDTSQAATSTSPSTPIRRRARCPRGSCSSGRSAPALSRPTSPRRPSRLIFNEPIGVRRDRRTGGHDHQHRQRPAVDLRASRSPAPRQRRSSWSPPTLPTTVAAGRHADPATSRSTRPRPVPRAPSSAIASDDADTPVAVVILRGLGTLGEGGSNEPSLQWILDTYQIPVNVGDPDPTDNSLPTDAARSATRCRSRASRSPTDGPVTLEPLAVFGPTSTSGTAVRVGYYNTGSAGHEAGAVHGPERERPEARADDLTAS